MRTQANITDRALRYRGVGNMPRCERRCHFCGDPGYQTNSGRPSIFVAHVSGDESDGDISNLSWTCRSCNSIASNTLQNYGIGRLTHQYNPSKSGGAANVAEWLNATACIVPRKGSQYSGENYGVPCQMGVSDAVRMIRATPHSKRSEFARKIWDNRKGRGNPMPAKFDRCVAKVKKRGSAYDPYAVCTAAGTRKRNSAEASHELYQQFHGFKPKIHEVVERDVHYHGNLVGLGELVLLVVVRLDGEEVEIEEFQGAMLSSNETGTQLYIEGGDQTVDLSAFGIRQPWKDKEYLGEVAEIRYFTDKTHLGDEGGEAEYYHELGEEGSERFVFSDELASGELPRLIYDVMNRSLSLAGGEYQIEAEGIRN